MKVLRVIASMDPTSGGPCQGLRNAIPELKKHGVDTEVVCLDSPDAAFISLDNFIVHAIGPGKTSWSYAPQLIPWLTQHLGGYDIVVVHGLWQYHGYAVMKAFKYLRQDGERNLPSFYVMPHGMLDPYFQRAAGRKLKAIRNWFYWKLIESKVINGADGVFFTCQEELALARQTFSPYHPKQELNVGYGIQEPPTFNASMKEAFGKKCPELGDRPFILFLSRIHIKKGVDLLIRAYQKIHEMHASEKEFPLLVVAGPGMDTAYGMSLKHELEKNESIRDKVFFTGMINGEAKWGAFYGAEAFILPSHQENFGIAVVEALACSKPVMISNQVNIWREIEQAGAGFVAEDDLEGVISLLTSWNQLSRDEKSGMSLRARETFKQFFAIESAAKRIVDIMNQSPVKSL